jgi:hypothetical protein
MKIQINTKSLAALGIVNLNTDFDKLGHDLYQKSKHFTQQGFVDLPFDKEIVAQIKHKIGPKKNGWI